jgi:SAM-dependent methyltransferase
METIAMSNDANPDCPVCRNPKSMPFRHIETVDYFKCLFCGSLFADPAFLAKAARGEAQTYRKDYWEAEQSAAMERCFGSSPIRMAETLLYCRRPVRRFLDIGPGSGRLLDSLGLLLPSAKDVFYGVDAFPPAPPNRTTNPNFTEGSVGDMTGPFDAGICVEVIEHLVPDTLRLIVRQLAAVSAPGALYFFNSGQPEFVEQEEPSYLDPFVRGHVVSYSLAGARAIFEPLGFNIIRLPGRQWAFLAEFGPVVPVSHDDLYTRLWTALPENLALLKTDPFGNLLYTAGLEAARCYLELGAPRPAPAGQSRQEPSPRVPVPAETRPGLFGRLLGGRA